MTSTILLDDIDTEAIVQRWVAKAAGEEKNRRDRFRMPFFSTATLYTPDGEKGVMCRDISKDGIGIIQFAEPPAYDSATLAVELHKQIVHLNVDFQWSRDMGNGWWTSGGRLNATSINNASLAFLKFSGMVERRLHQRYSFCHPFSVYPTFEMYNSQVGSDDLEPSDEAPALSLDISRGGMRLICFTPINYRKLIYIRKPKTDFLLQGRVVSHRDLGNGYCVVGAKFATT